MNLCYDNFMDAQPSKSQLRKQERLSRGLPAQCRSAETRKLVEISCEMKHFLHLARAARGSAAAQLPDGLRVQGGVAPYHSNAAPFSGVKK